MAKWAVLVGLSLYRYIRLTMRPVISIQGRKPKDKEILWIEYSDQTQSRHPMQSQHCRFVIYSKTKKTIKLIH